MTRTGARLWVLALATITWLRGQALDTTLFRGDTGAKKFTIIDQVTDAGERRAFLRLYEARDPGQRRKLAEAFAEQYPQSWLLAQAYEAAAKSCIDLEDYAQAVRYGLESLRLLPENPLLLVPLANVQVKLGQTAAAQQSARAALDYLDRFDAPASVPAARWPTLQAELRASSYFVLGRAAIAEALKAAGAERLLKLQDAETFLLQARSLNGSDAEIAYLLGLTELSSGKAINAAHYFAQARRASDPMGTQASENLRRIYGSTIHDPALSFDGFVERAETSGELRSNLATSLPAVIALRTTAGYTGSEACRQCHAAIYKSWQETGMGRMLRAYRPENVMGDFRTHNQFTGPNSTVIARMTLSGGKHFFFIRDSTGEWRSYPVDYTIGSKWQQAYATRLPSGDIHVFPIQYSAITKQWLNYWKEIDPPGSERTDVTGFNQLNSATSYQINCAPCHTSQLRLTQASVTAGHNLEFHEGGINCEMCHGPAQNHVVAMTARPGVKTAETEIVDFRKINASQYVAICGQCHAQSALRQPGANGEMNYPAKGAAFPPISVSRPYPEMLRRAFYKDGRFRETTFIVEAFRRTACFRQGGAHCGNCHQPHAADAASNPTSLKFAKDPDRMCLGCHAKFAANPGNHTHHAASSEGSRCVACHMPRIVNSLLFKARTHEIDDIPNAEMTRRFGSEESPNACLLCHTGENARWVELKLQAWSNPR